MRPSLAIMVGVGWVCACTHDWEPYEVPAASIGAGGAATISPAKQSACDNYCNAHDTCGMSIDNCNTDCSQRIADCNDGPGSGTSLFNACALEYGMDCNADGLGSCLTFAAPCY